MPDPWLRRRPRWAYPFTVLTQPGTVRLVAGEDYRYTLSAPGLDAWLPPVLDRFTGHVPLGQLLATLGAGESAALRPLVERLYGERVLVDGPATAAHAPRAWRWRVEGQGELCEALADGDPAGPDDGELVILCQDRLDYDEALSWNRRCRENNLCCLWASTGAVQRGYVGPLFLPDAGPCFGCLLRAFQRLSPAPEIYDALLDHAHQRRPIRPAPFPGEAVGVLRGLVLWKLRQAEAAEPAPALYRLHVLELEAMEVGTHSVFRDPECPECRAGGP
jgi:bacteriocin biosynthesis cyclodehydratase domain-containing protein